MKRIMLLACCLMTTLLFARNYQPLVLTVSKTQKNCYRTINDAINAAPAHAAAPVFIYIKNGIYNEKVLIDRPFIKLVGEDRDSTRILYAEINREPRMQDASGKPEIPGVIIIKENADDCTIARLTVSNDYGPTRDVNTVQQTTVFGQATRTIIADCNIFSDGNNCISLWNSCGGFYYLADCFCSSPGFDSISPRGWCFMTRCKIYGGGGAMLWHDGRCSEDAKLVIKDSFFDGRCPTVLGRYHRNSQFFLIDCSCSSKIIDHPVTYAYSDQVLDTISLGNRVYFYNFKRKGGNYPWMMNNLEESKQKPAPEEVTVQWTFRNEWNPESEIEQLKATIKKLR